MTFDVSLIPAEVANGENCVCILVDVIRASSAMATMADKGCPTIYLTDAIEEQLRSGNVEPGVFSCTEDYLGRCPDWADFSPSLVTSDAMESLSLHKVLMQTTNGTTAIHRLLEQHIHHILIGCMRNAHAVMEQAVDMAEKEGLGIQIVCAGRGDSTLYTMDDLYCAGHLLRCGVDAATQRGIPYVLHDSAKIATHFLDAYPSAEAAFSASASGAVMRRIGCQQDIALCAQDSVLDAVPYVKHGSSTPFIQVGTLPKPATIA